MLVTSLKCLVMQLLMVNILPESKSLDDFSCKYGLFLQNLFAFLFPQLLFLPYFSCFAD